MNRISIPLRLLFYRTRLQKQIADLEEERKKQNDTQEYLTSIRELLERLQITTLPKVPLVKLKKYIRLRCAYSFEFVFKLNLEGNRSEPSQLRGKNVEKYYQYFWSEYEAQLRAIFPEYKRTEDAVAINKNKWDRYNKKTTA